MFCNLGNSPWECLQLLFARLKLLVVLTICSFINPGCQFFPDSDRVYNQVESMPQPQAGFRSLSSHVTRNLIYPEEARQEGISGRVLLEFVVTESGSITNIKILDSLGLGCDQESIRVIRTSGPWVPGEKDGEPVKVRLVLPIDFVLDPNSL